METAVTYKIIQCDQVMLKVYWARKNSDHWWSEKWGWDLRGGVISGDPCREKGFGIVTRKREFQGRGLTRVNLWNLKKNKNAFMS